MAIGFSLAGSKNNVVVIDRTRAADPVQYTLKINLKNQGTTTVYYKITESSGTWSIVSPTDGELGSVASGSSAIKDITIQRALPTSDTIETVDFTLEVYSDSGYTNLIESTTFSLTIIMADIHSWPSYTKYGFDDGTLQGWNVTTSGYGEYEIRSDKSITSGGYSFYFLRNATAGSATVTLSRSETLPSNSRVVMMMYLTGKFNSDEYLNYVEVRVNGNTVYRTGSKTIATTLTTWDMIGVDLSDYAGQSVTVEIELGLYAGYANYGYLDDIIFAGTDTL